MASAKELKKQKQRIEEIQREQATKPKSISTGVKQIDAQFAKGVDKGIVSHISSRAQMVNTPTGTERLNKLSSIIRGEYQPQTGAPGFKSMGRGRRKNRMGLYNKIK